MSKVLELQDQLNRLNTEMRAVNDTATDGVLTPEKDAEYTRMDTEFRTLEKALERETALEARSRQFITEAHKKVIQQQDKLSKEEVAEKRSEAFEFYMRFGKENLTVEQRSLLVEAVESRAQSSSNTAGGYLIPREFAGRIEQFLKDYGGMLEVGEILTTGTGAGFDLPTSDDTANKGYIVGENADVTGGSTDLAFGQVSISAFNYTSGFIKIPYTLLEDSFFDLNGFAAEAIATRINRALNTHLTTGDGSAKPAGIVPAVVAAGSNIAAGASAITFDNLIDLQHAVNSAYRKNGGWMFSDQTLKVLRKIKDNDGRYIWQPADVRTGSPATLLGAKFTINDDMETVATGKTSVLWGDLSKYVIRRVNGSRIKRLEERFAELDQIALLGFMRFDGKLTNTAAVKCITHA
jgi:HK97 family phage major capsid protein